MYGKELNERNPLRLFEHSIHGGLGRGNIGVVVARHGIGKTAFLVGIALDDAMRGRKSLHVSLDKTVDHVREFYDEIFMDLAHSAHLEDLPVRAARDGTQPHNSHLCGQIVHDPQASPLDQFPEGVCPLRSGMPDPRRLRFRAGDAADMEAFRQLATDFNVEMWMSAVTHRGVPLNEHGIPEPLAKLASAIAVIVQMTDDNDGVQLSLLKDHDNPDVAKLTARARSLDDVAGQEVGCCRCGL